MSIAPANRASMAAGPALKLVHCTLTWGPIALSKKPLALPTIACACVMFGNAPTRIMFALPCANPEIVTARKSKVPRIERLVTLFASNHHGEDVGGIFLLSLVSLAAFARGSLAGDQIGERRVIENASGCVAHIEKYLVERPMGKIAMNQIA